ncbi:hypothetical protein ABW19_dt0205608 [Dactylella cylindrospora]|nr:hypothetical protein ABW19_dt0205608 [Dactylella cylindrospora]
MAHDPIRYIGDMLAWLHSALVSELEALQAIFEISSIDTSPKGSSAAVIDIILEDDLHLRDLAIPLTDRSLEGVLSTLRLRTEQVISSHEDPILLYGMLNILTFYRETFTKLLGSGAALVAATDR